LFKSLRTQNIYCRNSSSCSGTCSCISCGCSYHNRWTQCAVLLSVIAFCFVSWQ